MWCEQSGSSMEAQIQPAGWTAPQPDVASPLLFMHLFLSSAELSEPKVPPHLLLPSRPVLQPYTYPLPMKAGKYSMALTRNKKEKKARDRQTDTERRETGRGRERSSDVSLTFLSFPPFLLRSLPVSLPAWLVKVSAAWRAGLFWQPSNS